MIRVGIAGGLIASLALVDSVPGPSPVIKSATRWAATVEASGLAPVPDCRVATTAATTRSKAPGFSAETTTTCQHDRATSKSTCTNKYSDSVGTSTSTVAVTTFASVADLVDEVNVIPPRRRSLRTDITTTGTQGSATSSVVNAYDEKNRLVQEVGESPAGPFTTTYSAWDEAGRPTAGKTVTRGNINSLNLAYDDAARTVTTTTDSGLQKLVCVLTFDANGNPAATSCKTPGGITNSSTTTTATEKICR
jgi:hypothetical protein